MVKLILDYKQTTQKSPCKLCNKLILKGQSRVKIEGSNNAYMRDYVFFHTDCLISKLGDFKKQIPSNKLELNDRED